MFAAPLSIATTDSGNSSTQQEKPIHTSPPISPTQSSTKSPTRDAFFHGSFLPPPVSSSSSAAPASPSPSASSRSQDDLLQVVMKGDVFVKHGRRGKPHPRRVWVSSDLSTLNWSESVLTNSIPDRTFKMRDFRSVLDDFPTSTLRRTISSLFMCVYLCVFPWYAQPSLSFVFFS